MSCDYWLRTFLEIYGVYRLILDCPDNTICILYRYSETFKYAGDYVDKTASDEDGIKQKKLVAIDAMEFHHNPSSVTATFISICSLIYINSNDR